MNIRLTAMTGLCLVNLLGPLVERAGADSAAATPAVPATAATSAGTTPVNGTGFRLGPNEPPTGTLPPNSESWFDRVLSVKVPLTFGIIAAETASDNIFYQPKGTSDYITEISPFLTLTLGTPIKLQPALDEETIYDETDSGNLNYLQVTARPTITLFAKNPDLDVVDQYEDAIYSHQFSKFTVSIEQKYEKLSEPTIEDTAAGTLINRDIYTTTARTSYINSDKLSTYGTANQILSDYKSSFYTDSTEWNADYYFLYQFFPKLSLGLGPKIGFIEIEKAPSQRYQSLLVHAYYLATGKLSFMGAAGAEVREYQDNTNPTSVSPILEAQGIYRPFDSMTISLNASRDRTVSNSQVGQDYTTSAVSVQLRQRFLQVVYLTLTGGYQNDQYTGAVAGPQREDNYYYSRVGVEWASKDWLIIDGSYQYSRDNSNNKLFTFDENRFSVSATLKY